MFVLAVMPCWVALPAAGDATLSHEVKPIC